MIRLLLVLGGCAGDGGSSDEPLAWVELSEQITTVATVHWTTREPTTGAVEYGEDLDLVTPWDDTLATEHSATLVGLPAETSVPFRVVWDDGSGERAGPELALVTGRLPADLPSLAVEGAPGDEWIVTTFIGVAPSAVIADPEGRVVWYFMDDTGWQLVTRARLSRDRRSVLYGVQSQTDGIIRRVSIDGSEDDIVLSELFSHDFLEHSDGTIACIEFDERKTGMGHMADDARGDRIVEISPEGERTVIWSTWDDFDPPQGPSGTPLTLSWTHANSLDYDEETETYFISLRDLSSILAIDRATGSIQWVLGGEQATIPFSEDSDPFYYQHGFERVDDHIVIFDNHTRASEPSRVVEYELGAEATETWSYAPDPTIVAYALGDVDRLDSGDTFIDWSSAGQMQRVSEKGEVEWQVNAQLGHAFGYAQLVEDLYVRE